MSIRIDGSLRDISQASGRRENGVKHIYGLALLTPTDSKTCMPDLLHEDTLTLLNRTFSAGKLTKIYPIHNNVSKSMLHNTFPDAFCRLSGCD
jgi:hypothetical protein